MFDVILRFKGVYLIKHFIQGHHTQQLITLTISVIEESYLQFSICKLIAF